MHAKRHTHGTEMLYKHSTLLSSVMHKLFLSPCSSGAWYPLELTYSCFSCYPDVYTTNASKRYLVKSSGSVGCICHGCYLVQEAAGYIRIVGIRHYIIQNIVWSNHLYNYIFPTYGFPFCVMPNMISTISTPTVHPKYRQKVLDLLCSRTDQHYQYPP